MPKLRFPDPRRRIINFRVTEQEYTTIISACQSWGGQNVSEFARRAAMDLACARTDNHKALDNNKALESHLQSLEQHLSKVDLALGELVSTIRGPQD